MKNLLLICSLGLFLLIPDIYGRSGRVGDEKGNGGGAFTCRDDQNKLLDAILIDTFEAEAEFGLTLVESSELSLEQLIEYALIRFQSSRATQLLKEQLPLYVEHIRDIMKIRSNISIVDTGDLIVSVYPRVCEANQTPYKMENIASYTISGNLLIDKEIYASLSLLERAALIFHEAIYLMARDEYDTDTSTESRWLVGHLFSDFPAELIPRSIVNLEPFEETESRRWICKTNYEMKQCFTFKGCSLYDFEGLQYQRTLEVTGRSRLDAFKALKELIEPSEYYQYCNKIEFVRIPDNRSYTSIKMREATCHEEVSAIKSCERNQDL